MTCEAQVLLPLWCCVMFSVMFSVSSVLSWRRCFTWSGYRGDLPGGGEGGRSGRQAGRQGTPAQSDDCHLTDVLLPAALQQTCLNNGSNGSLQRRGMAQSPLNELWLTGSRMSSVASMSWGRQAVPVP
jgi:hypothetical protein